MDLPATWQVHSLGDVIADIRPGFASGRHNEEGRGIAHLRPMNITLRGTINLDRLKYVPAESSALRAATGDILFNNTNSLEHVGKSAALDMDGEWAYSNHLTRLRTPDIVIPKFVVLQLQLLWRTGYFKIHARRHVNQVSISVRQLKSIPLIVPPTDEQRRLVEDFEQQSRILDGIEIAIEDAMVRLSTYENQTIAAAATGTLLRELPGHRGPTHWKMTSIANAGQIQLGKKRAPKSHSGPNMKPYLRVANVLENRLDLADVHAMHFTPAEFEKYKLLSGDVLLNEGQSPDLVGRPAMYRGEIDDCCFQMTLIRFRSNHGISPTFALLVFRHYLHSGRFRQAARWSTNIAHLTAVRFAALEFPQVPLEEQEAIVEEATSRLEIVTELRNTLSRLLDRVSAARDIILAETFHVSPSPIEGPHNPIEGLDAEVAQRAVSANEGWKEDTLMADGSPKTRRTLLEILEQEGRPDPSSLFSQAGFTKASADEFYREIRDLLRSARLVEVRSSDGAITLQLTGTN